MPQVFKVGGYLVYFWVNENDPLEPVHVHVRKQGKLAKFEIVNGTARPIFGKLSNADMAKAGELATKNSVLIVSKWFEIFG